MIYLQDLFDDLAFGELTNMAISKSNSGTIKVEQYPKLVSFINKGLLDLCTRFILRKKEFNLYQRSGYTTYYLRPENVGNPSGGDPDVYIDGTQEDAVDGDIIKIIEAYDSLGNAIHINDKRYPDDIFLPEPDIIKITERDPLEIISCVYQAAFPKIIIDANFKPSTYKLYIPSYIVEPLVAFTAAKLFAGKASQAVEGQANMSNTFIYKYERLCNDLLNNSIIPKEEEINDKFQDNGWC